MPIYPDIISECFKTCFKEFKSFCPVHVIRIREDPLGAVVKVRLVVDVGDAVELGHGLIDEGPRVAVPSG